MHGAPASQDKPAVPMLDEVLALAPDLEANWATEYAAFPPGAILNIDPPDGGDEGTPPEPGPESSGEPVEGGESFYDFDPSKIPEGTDPLEWVGQQYGEMRKAFSQKTMGIADTRRKAEETQMLIDGLSDPETMPHYMRLLGISFDDPQVLEALGINVGGGGDLDELEGLLDDEPDEVETRIERLEREREEDQRSQKEAAYEQALDDLADQELEKIEGEWGRELDEDEDAFIRHRAEANVGRDGLPNYEAAAKTLKSFLARRVDEELKRRSEPGRGGANGRPGGKALDPNKAEDRMALGAEAADRALASQG